MKIFRFFYAGLGADSTIVQYKVKKLKTIAKHRENWYFGTKPLNFGWFLKILRFREDFCKRHAVTGRFLEILYDIIKTESQR